MKVGTKTTLTVLGTLVIGIVVGALGSGALLFRNPPPLPLDRMNPERFADRFERTMDIEESKRDTVRAILEAHADRFMELGRRHSSELCIMMDSLTMELSGVLTEEQMERLKRLRDQRRKPPPFGDRHRRDDSLGGRPDHDFFDCPDGGPPPPPPDECDR